MNFIGGADSFRYFKIISVNNKKVKDEGRYKTKGSPGDAAKKAFTQLSKKYKTNKLTFSIKETTQGSNKKEHGPYLGEKIKLKKPLTVKYKGKNGKNKPVSIKYETKVHLVKDHKQKGGILGGGGKGKKRRNREGAGKKAAGGTDSSATVEDKRMLIFIDNEVNLAAFKDFYENDEVGERMFSFVNDIDYRQAYRAFLYFKLNNDNHKAEFVKTQLIKELRLELELEFIDEYFDESFIGKLSQIKGKFICDDPVNEFIEYYEEPMKVSLSESNLSNYESECFEGVNFTPAQSRLDPVLSNKEDIKKIGSHDMFDKILRYIQSITGNSKNLSLCHDYKQEILFSYPYKAGFRRFKFKIQLDDYYNTFVILEELFRKNQVKGRNDSYITLHCEPRTNPAQGNEQGRFHIKGIHTIIDPKTKKKRKLEPTLNVLTRTINKNGCVIFNFIECDQRHNTTYSIFNPIHIKRLNTVGINVPDLTEYFKFLVNLLNTIMNDLIYEEYHKHSGRCGRISNNKRNALRVAGMATLAHNSNRTAPEGSGVSSLPAGKMLAGSEVSAADAGWDDAGWDEPVQDATPATFAAGPSAAAHYNSSTANYAAGPSATLAPTNQDATPAHNQILFGNFQDYNIKFGNFPD